MNGRAWLVAGVLAATALSLAMRLPRLSDRPMHTDEAVQAVIAADLWQTGQYRYDRTEYHGPTLPYLTQISLRLSRASGFADTTEAMYRIVPALAGAAMVLLVLLLADGLGRSATLWAAVLMAVSAGLSYYSRYFIHETLLALFTLAAIACGWRWYRDGGLGWAATTGACVGLMAATKETWVIAAACMGAAAIVDWRLRRLYSPLPAGGGRGEGAGAHPGADTASPADADFDELGRVAHPRPLPWGQVGIAAGCAALVATVLFTSFLSNPRGILDAVLAWQPYLSRSGGDPRHVHPWYFYLQPLLWQRYGRGPLFTEAFIIGLAVVGAVASFVRGRQMPLGRVLTFYTVFLTAAYAAIPYKTPWCMLGFLHRRRDGPTGEPPCRRQVGGRRAAGGRHRAPGVGQPQCLLHLRRVAGESLCLCPRRQRHPGTGKTPATTGGRLAGRDEHAGPCLQRRPLALAVVSAAAEQGGLLAGCEHCIGSG